ncbi:MAG: DUF2505 family protein [Myxococcales bacterium]|nr:DUF2505 family protein [Myxococcales bacterium]MDD9967138.1 DUF2505 family protein [Myxococcales bacterium]
MRYRISHMIETDPQTFWEVFFDEAYNRALSIDHLGFSRYDVLSFERHDDGRITKRIEAAPEVELPGPVKKAFGHVTSYIEAGTFDPSTSRYVVDVIPSAAADKIKTKIEIWIEPRGDKRVERMVEVDNTVKIFGVGKLVEKFLEQQTREAYSLAAEFTNRWIAEKNL